MAMALSANAALFQYVTATDPSSITKNASNVVSAWADKSGNALNASVGAGSVTHPAVSLFSSGNAGLDFGAARNSLQLLSVANAANLLDFNGAAAAHTGFAMLVSVRVDQLNSDWNDLLGVTSALSGGFGLRYSNAGVIQTYMGGVTVQRPGADREVAAGDSVVFAVNYNATSGKLTLWDSLNQTEVSGTVPKANFAASKTLLLGSMDNAGRFIRGSVGEVRLYDSLLSDAAFSSARTAMSDVWVKKPLQALDASLAGSVVGTNPVTQWTDQSGNANHATGSTGSVTYPATNLFNSGTAGVQFGPTVKSLRLLSVANAAGLLDFNGAASAHTGFSVLVSVRLDQLSTANLNDIIGVTTDIATGGFGLRFNTAGQIVTYMGGVSVARPASDREVGAGNTVTIGVNYDAASGVITLWDSLNETELTGTVIKGNFAGTNKTLQLGSIDSTSRFLNGSVGEVKIFDEKLSAGEFASQRDAMTKKWLGVAPAMPSMPGTPAFTITQLLNWTPTGNPDHPFNVATVPLQSRINVPAALKANTNAKSGQGGIQALDTYSGDRPQGGNGSVYTFSYWQYLEEAVYWNGIGEINYTPPTGEMIDNAHRNGVPILGTVFFPPTVFGGVYSRVQTFLNKVGNTYPAADKLIEIAEYYGFDGWFINQETEGGNAADAAAMRDLIRYIRLNSSLKIVWYDSMTEAGNIAWQDHLNTNNDWYLRHNYTTGLQDNTGSLIADSMFIDFSNDTSTNLPNLSGNRAADLGLNRYKIWTGLETQAEDFRTSTAGRVKMAKAFPDGQNHITSVGLYLPRTFATQLPEQDLFWTGDSGDPRNTSGTVSTGPWKGVAHNIAERSVINSLPFATDFCIGQGNHYYNNGVIVKPGAWWNRALQAVLPTWRWIIDSTGTKLTPELWNGDSYRGGSCLRVSGNLNAENTLRLYLTDLPVTADTRLKIIFKRNGLSGVDSLMQVGVSTAATPTAFTFYPAGTCAINGWNQTTINLSAHAGTNIAALALKFASGAAVSSYEIRVGEIVVYNASAPVPVPPTNVQAIDVVGWNGLVSGRVKWDHAAGDHYFYNVYVRLTNGSLVFVGSTPANHFYFEDIAISGSYSSVVVQTVGSDTTESRLSDAPAISPDLTWDASISDAPITAGSGEWRTTVANNTTNTIWNDGSSNVSWNQTSATSPLSSATFAGADGTVDQYVVTLDSQIAASALTFNSNGYKTTGGTIHLGTGTTTIAANKTATINSTMGYSTNSVFTTTVNAGATLNLGGGISGGPQPRYGGAGTLNFTAGTYANSVTYFNTANISQTGGTVSLTSTGGNWIGYTSGQNVNYTISGGTLSINTAAAGGQLVVGRALSGQQATLTVQNGGTVNIGTTAANHGALYLGGGDATANSLLDVQGGTLTIGTGQTTNRLIFFNNGANAGRTATMTQSGGTVTANGIQFGNGAATYNATASATLQLSGGNLYVGSLGITRSSNAATLPITLQLQGGTLGASADWSSSLDMKLGTTLGGVTLQAADATVVARQITLSGVLSNDGAVNGTLTKTGAGTLTLTNNNTYTGSTTVSAGSLTLAGAFTNNLSTSTSIEVASGASLNVSGLTSGRIIIGNGQTLKGSGTVTGSVTVGGSARLSPGTTAGQLAITGSLDLSTAGAGTLLFDLNNLAVTNDRVAVTGTVALGGGTLGFNDFAFTNLGGLQVGTYKLVTSGGITGTLDAANLTGTMGSLAGRLQINGNDLELAITVGGYVSWATANGIPGAPPTDDFDMDGLTNLAEYALGKNPKVPSPPAGTLSGDTITYTKGSDSIAYGDVSWIIETSETLAADSWKNAVVQSPGNTNLTISHVFIPGTPVKKFARLKVLSN
jgi:mannosyl-glycoprotein endo-beta-N-acetylglucosaminidase